MSRSWRKADTEGSRRAAVHARCRVPRNPAPTQAIKVPRNGTAIGGHNAAVATRQVEVAPGDVIVPSPTTDPGGGQKALV